MRQWKHFDERYTTGNILERYTAELPGRRRGCYKFSSHHPDFGNCTYDGYWLYGKPHGRFLFYLILSTMNLKTNLIVFRILF